MDLSGLQYLGVSSGIISILGVVIIIIKKLPLKSKCITDQNGDLHLDIKFSNNEINEIKNDEQLKKMFLDLKDEINKKKSDHKIDVK